MIQSQWPPDPMQLPESQWDRLMGLPAGKCVYSELTAVVYYSRVSPGIQLMANIKAVPGILEQRECGWRSSPMNSASYMGQTPSARCMNAHYQFMEPLNTPCFSSNSFFSLVFKESWVFFFFLFEHEFRQFKLPLNDKLRVPRWKKGPMCLKHLGRSIFLISSSAVNSADQKVDQRLPGDRHLRLPPAEDRERN